MNHDVFYTRFVRLDNNEVESWDLYVTWWDWHFKNGDNIHGILDFNPIYERLFERFAISPGVILQPGEYKFTRFRTNLFSSATRRRLSGSLTVTFGDYWSGKAEQIQTGIRISCRQDSRSPEYESNVRPPAGRLLHRADCHVERELRRVPAPVVLKSHSARQPIGKSRMAEPGPLDAQAGQRRVLRVQPGMGAEEGDNDSLRFHSQDSKVSAKFQYSFRF